MHHSIEVQANDAGLIQLLRFVDEAERDLALQPEQEYLLRLAIEEIATNLIKYGYHAGESGPVRVTCLVEGGVLRVEICDRSAPFDPRDAPLPDLTSDLAHRHVGGLGLFLVRELADELSYRHDAATGWNALTIIKRAEHHRV